MARNHGRVLTSIWSDPAFRKLGPGPQRLYLILISQPNLAQTGVLSLTARRWAAYAEGVTTAEIQRDLAILAEARFVVVDEDTEEVLVRSFVRNDGVWKQPKVMQAMESQVPEIASPVILDALRSELARIDLAELSDRPAPKSQVSPRGEVAAVLSRLLGTPTSALRCTRDDGVQEGLDLGVDAGVDPTHNARARPFSPSPSPIPIGGSKPIPLPDAFGPDYAVGAVKRYASEHGMDPATAGRELVKFRNYHLEKRTTSPAWERRWLTWVINWEERQTERHPEPAAPGGRKWGNTDV